MSPFGPVCSLNGRLEYNVIVEREIPDFVLPSSLCYVILLSSNRAVVVHVEMLNVPAPAQSLVIPYLLLVDNKDTLDLTYRYNRRAIGNS